METTEFIKTVNSYDIIKLNMLANNIKNMPEEDLDEFIDHEEVIISILELIVDKSTGNDSEHEKNIVDISISEIRITYLVKKRSEVHKEIENGNSELIADLVHHRDDIINEYINYKKLKHKNQQRNTTDADSEIRVLREALIDEDNEFTVNF